VKAIREFADALRFFLTRYPRRTVAVFAASIGLSSVELMSASMILPVLTLGLDTGVDNALVQAVRDVFEAIGIEFSFYWTLAVFLIGLVIKAIVEMVFGIFVDTSRVLIAKDFRAGIIAGLQRVSWSYLVGKPHGLIVNLMTQEIDRATSIFGLLQTVSVSFLMLVVYVMLGIVVSSELLVAAAILGIVGILVARPMFAMARRAGAGEIEHLRDLSADLLQGIQALKAFKAMGRERPLLRALSESNDAYLGANQLKVLGQRLLTASQQLVLAGGIVAGVYFGKEVLEIGLADVGFMAIVLMRLNTNVATLMKKFQAVASMHYALLRIEEFHDEIAEHAERHTGTSQTSFPTEITFENVGFDFDGRAVLKDVNLVIPPSGLVTIVGPSGAGKTTLIDILCGMRKPASGRVLVNGEELSDLDMRWWRQNIGYVTQEPNLLHFSIGRNVAGFDESVRDEDIENALRVTGAFDWVSSLKDGYDSDIGVLGGKISGGERQRIAMARAIARKPKLLILDEPTAAVDARIEQQIIKTILQIKETIPIIAISHQPALADAADILCELKDGRIRRVSSDSALDGKRERQPAAE